MVNAKQHFIVRYRRYYKDSLILTAAEVSAYNIGSVIKRFNRIQYGLTALVAYLVIFI
jgi:hypothetical protein